MSDDYNDLGIKNILIKKDASLLWNKIDHLENSIERIQGDCEDCSVYNELEDSLYHLSRVRDYVLMAMRRKDLYKTRDDEHD